MPRPHAPQIPADVGTDMLFLAAIVDRALQDLTADNPAIREDATRFWDRPEHVHYWSDLLDIEPQRLLAAVQRQRLEA
jgi:hypothetical protein